MERLFLGGEAAHAALYFLESIPLSALILGLLSVLGGSLVYYYVVLPINWIRDLSDVGFDYVRGKSRAAFVQETQRKRRVGNLPPVFPNGWFGLIESSQIAVGSVHNVAALGQNFAVFRGESGDIHVVDAYCPHMGANMSLGGKVRGDCLECPFHAWTFDGTDGKCVKIPYAAKVPDIARLRSWDCVEANGFVFVWFDAEKRSPSWRPQQISSLNGKSWAFVGRSEYLVSCHIQEIPENGADIAHLNVLHGPGLVAPAFTCHSFDAQWTPCTESGLTHTAGIQMKHQTKIFDKINIITLDVKVCQIGPGYVEFFFKTPFGPMLLFQTVTPVEPLLQKVIHRMYCPPAMLLYAKVIFLGECFMFERDIAVWNHKKYEDKPLLVTEDKAVSKYRRWYSQFYSENSPKYTGRKDNLEW